MANSATLPTFCALYAIPEYNEKLLSQLAQAGNGRYVYVSEPDKIPAAFERELGSLVAVVAQNATLRMPLPPEFEVKQVYGREEPLKPGLLEIPLGDLTSEQEIVVLVKLRVIRAPKTALELPLTLTYDDVAAAQRVDERRAVVLKHTSNGNSTIAETNPVLAYARVVEAVDKISLAVRSMDRNLAAEVFDIRDRKYPTWKQVAIDSLPTSRWACSIPGFRTSRRRSTSSRARC